jgi:predicted enzyme related to lactoylglutathione lyase
VPQACDLRLLVGWQASNLRPSDEQAWMLNFRVRDLDAMVAQLRAAGVGIDSQETQEGVGRFAWLVDPEGNRVELWEPTP